MTDVNANATPLNPLDQTSLLTTTENLPAVTNQVTNIIQQIGKNINY